MGSWRFDWGVTPVSELDEFLDDLTGIDAAAPAVMLPANTQDLTLTDFFVLDEPEPPSPVTIAERVTQLQAAFPEAESCALREFARDAGEGLIRFILDANRTPRETAVFRMVFTAGYVTKEMCAKAGFDVVVTRDLAKHGVLFTHVKGRHYLNVRESRADHGGPDYIPSHIRRAVFERDSWTCGSCHHKFDSKGLNPDHIIPHRVAGKRRLTLADLWTLCLSCNRRKQKACQSCPNQNGARSPDTCKTCRFSSPTNYTHVATQVERHVSFVARNEQELLALQKVEDLAQSLGLVAR